jgi:GPH family glycoside/pentoside/hexuronide:cation symporter
MSHHEIKRIKTSQCVGYGTAGLADTFLTFGITTLVMPIYNIGMGIDAKLIGWALVFPRILDALTDPLMGNISDNTRSRFGRRRQYVLLGIILCALLFPFVWMPPAASDNVIVGYLIGIMCLFSISYTIFNVPYTALGYEITQDYDERTRLFAWRMYFATAAGVTIQWLYKLCLMAGETEVEGVRVVSWVIAAIVLGFGVIPAFAAHEQTVVEDQEKVNVFKSIKSAMRNRPFILLIISYVILVTALFSTGALGLYINIFYVFDGDKESAATVAAVVGTILIASAFVGMLLVKKLSELTSKKTAMITSMSAALFAVLLSWFTLTPKMPYLQIVHTVIMGMGVQGGWLLFSSLLGDVCDEDERNTGLRQEGIYSAVMGFCNKCAGAFVGVGAAYMLEFSGYVAGMDPDPEVGYRMKVIFVAMQAVGLLVAIVLMALFPIGRKRAEQTRRILDERKHAAAGAAGNAVP